MGNTLNKPNDLVITYPGCIFFEVSLATEFGKFIEFENNHWIKVLEGTVNFIKKQL